MFNPSGDNMIKRTNLYEAVTEKIEYMMIDGSLPLGTKLPSEQAMADYFYVSRNVIREAYKTLRERGLIEVKNGEGAIVKKPEPSMLSDMLRRMLALESVNFKDLYELRSALEVNACKLFIRKITDEKMQGLNGIFDKMQTDIENQDEWVQLDLDFHRYIVKASENEILYRFYKPVLAALRYIFTASWQIPGAKEKGLNAHRAILQAITEGNERTACDCMEKHLSESLKDIEKYNKSDTKENS